MTEPLGRGLSELVDPAAYANGYPHRIWTLLRRESPVAWCEIPEVRPFWAITKHADILRISRAPATFSSTGRLAIGPGDAALPDDGPPFRHLLQMDPPEHGKYRRLVSGRFTPRSLATLEPHLVAIAREIVDDVASTVVQDAAESGELDFVESIAARLPLAVICEMLGVPRDDWDLIFHLTNEHLGAADPEYHVDGESPAETSDRARRDLFDYFTVLARARGSPPGDDLVSVLAEAQIDDAPVPQFELLSYLLLLIVAGNGRNVLRRRQPRSRGVPRSRSLGRGPIAQRSPGVRWRRTALLPRRPSRAARGAHPPPRSVAASGRTACRRRRRMAPVRLHCSAADDACEVSPWTASGIVQLPGGRRSTWGLCRADQGG